MPVCTLLQTDKHTSTPPLSFLQAGCPSCRPTNSVKALKAQQHAEIFWFSYFCMGWLGSRVVSVLDSGKRARVQIAVEKLSGNSLSLLGKLFIPIVPLFTKQQKW